MDKNYALSLLGNDFNTYVNAAFDNNEISKDEWYELNKIYYTKSYLSKDNPRAQSGHGGDEFHYLFTHMQIIEAIYKNGSFCDIGCANGHLMEMVYKWAAGIGFDLQMFGVDISEGLIEFAQKRLPQWNDNFFVGNAHYWKPEQKFDYIHIRGELVESPYNGPKKIDNHMIFEHYMENFLVDGGRFIIGPYWYENEDCVLKGLLNWGYSPTGYSEKTHYNKPNILRKVIWVDKNSNK
jgi:hypothetical protein